MLQWLEAMSADSCDELFSMYLYTTYTGVSSSSHMIIPIHAWPQFFFIAYKNVSILFFSLFKLLFIRMVVSFHFQEIVHPIVFTL